MKQLITIVVMIFNTFLWGGTEADVKAQPNGGFESWSTQYNYENPSNWQTLNVLSVFGNPLSAFKATGVDKHSGNYALMLKTVFLNNNPAPHALRDTMGYTFLGKIALSPPSIKFGIPYVGRPEKLEFWSKYIPVGTDRARAYVILQKWNGTKTDTIAMGDLTIDTTLTYTLFQVNLNYFSNELSDTLIIGFSSSYSNSLARVGSVLYIDDVAFTGWVGIDEPVFLADKIKIFPNPAKDNVNIKTQIEEADNIQIIDIMGKLVGVYKIQNLGAKINTSSFAEGVYFCEIRDKKNGILTKGKFNVVR